MSDIHSLRKYRRHISLDYAEREKRYCSLLMALLALGGIAGVVLGILIV